MPIKLSEIKGAMVKNIPSDFINDGAPFNNGKAVGYTIAINQTGRIQLDFDRENLALIIEEELAKDKWVSATKLANAIRSSIKEILVVVK